MNHHDDETDRWIEWAVGTPVESSEVLLGGMSSVVRRITLADGSAIVVRHITNREWLMREPDLISREARALELLVGSTVPAPKLVVSDPGAGRLAMTMLPGAAHHASPQLRSSTEALADLAAAVAGVPLPAGHGLPMWRSWAPADPTPPAWGDSGLWAECLAAYATEQPPLPENLVLLHRDFHPLNVLW